MHDGRLCPARGGFAMKKGDGKSAAFARHLHNLAWHRFLRVFPQLTAKLPMYKTQISPRLNTFDGFCPIEDSM
jgi:hypothetical protein